MASPHDMFEGGRSSRTFTAKFPGICEECQEGFEAGTEVRYDGSDLVHADPDDCETVSASRTTHKSQVCTYCWLVHAGPCDREPLGYSAGIRELGYDGDG